ncbi:D-tyrosyl-tRNA(Tyr) deacylase [Nitrosotalea sinensis]|uniref:D-aminoacyl-tRNA deacylase n=1 Tax=Nitrosotalea sinensis TaxID=1499975 RepID=A0A2H1EF08_9ARCH|nr:D-aminoacyl-tRNA deacylase [Candidatus Nitrosotalea sinensis]SHO42491.1 D-tyrosyl-tRNA(Tyr) deacylase [Candidatus Nitrosotalea sinensis]
MELLIAYESDPAGYNMAYFISKQMKKDGEIYRGKYFDLVVIPTPAISADWIEDKYHYDGYVFLSKHAAESGTLALTCHSTGNFGDAMFGGFPRQVAIPHPHIQKSYMKKLWERKNLFSKFDIIIEATHHGPTALGKPSLFIEIGTTEKEWNDKQLCEDVSEVVVNTMSEKPQKNDVAICFGGTHYPSKFNKELIEGKLALGTIIPKHGLDNVDSELFDHILKRNSEAKLALVDWNGLGSNKQKIVDMINSSRLEMIKI